MVKLLASLIFIQLLFTGFSATAQTSEWLHLTKSNTVSTLSESDDHVWVGDGSGLTLIDKKSGRKTYLNKTTTPWIDCYFRRILVGGDGSAWAWPYRDYFYHKDGSEWTKYTADNTPLSSTYLPAALDENNVLWMTDSVLLSFDGTKWSSHDFPSSFGTFYTYLMVAHEGAIWLASDVGLLRFEEGEWTRYYFDSQVDNAYISHMNIDANGNPWLLSFKTLYHLKDKKLTPFHEAPEEVVSTYSSMHVFDENNIWLGAEYVRMTPGGIPTSVAYHFNGSEWTSYSNSFSGEHNLPLLVIKDVFGSENGDVWFSGTPLPQATSAVVRKAGKECILYDYSQAKLNNGSVLNVSSLKEGAVVNCVDGGLSMYQKGAWNLVEPYDERFMAFCTDGSGTVYSKSQDHVKIHSASGGTTVATYPSDFGMHYVNVPTNVQVDGKGDVWIDFATAGTEFGPTRHNIARYDGSAWISYHKTVDSFPESFFIEMDVDSKGNLWVRNENGLYQYSKGSFQQITTYPTELPLHYTGFEVDINGNFWLPGTRGDLFRYDGTDWHHHENTFSAQSDWGVAIDSDPNGAVFMKVESQYFYKFDGQTWTEFTKENSAIPNSGNIWSLSIDAYGNVWMGTSTGVLVYREGGVTFNDGLLSAGSRDLTLFPNPCTDQVEVRLPTYLENPYVEVFNLEGQSVYGRNYGGTDRILVQDLALLPGVYVLVVRAEDGTVYSASKLVVTSKE